MVCSFVDPEKIKEWIEICKLMKTLDKMVCFKFTPKELTIQMIHPSRRSVLDMTFPKEWFHHYEWKDCDFYISTKSLYTIFSLYSGENMLSMDFENKFMNIKFFHEHHTKNFSIVLNLKAHTNVVIEKEKGISFFIDSVYFNSLCEQLYQFGDFLMFNIRKEFFHMISYGNEKMVIEINPSRIDVIEEGEYEQSYPLIYLLMFLKFSVLYPKVLINIHKNLHISIEKGYTVNYFLAHSKS
jgi:hypothetical protein